MSTKSLASSVSAFLSSTRAAGLRGLPPLASLTIVLGNPSADLDSFISAVVYAYFCSAPLRKDNPKRWFIPVLNLPTTPACDLWRLRPEFATALKLAEGRPVEHGSRSAVKDENNRVLLGQLITISDIHSASKATPISLFSNLQAHSSSGSSEKNDYVLVDHNAPTIPTLSIEDLNRHVNITGCIDHHVDECFVRSDASPRIIQTGVGSCTSLVVQHLRDLWLWPLPDEGYATGELARLALAPILIDTANLTAKGKVSDTDRNAVAFLESCIQSNSSSGPGPKDWDRKAFYDEIATTKANSLDLLTIPEIFERDYKEWTESTKSGDELNMGISSIVKPISWLLQKAESAEEFLNQVHTFTQDSEHKLALFGIMTTFTGESGDFQRELLVTASGNTALKVLNNFGGKATKELILKPWNTDSELLDLMKARMSGTSESSCIWWQKDVAKSRKQVAPLLREVVRGC
jgi:exopolyphosphatase